MQGTSPSQALDLRRVWRRFLGVHAGFALAFGFFGAYSLLYLGVQFKAAGVRGGVLDQLLPILGASMLLDAIVGPLAGNYADAGGRRRATTLSLVFLALSLGCGLLMGSVIYDASLSFLIFDLGMAAQILLALSAAFYATSLDAWWVDLLQDANPREKGSTFHRYFSSQAQIGGFFLVLGGLGSLLLGPWLTGGPGGAKFGISAWEPGCRIFWVGLALCVLLALAVRYGLPMPSRDSRLPMGLSDEVKWKARKLWHTPGLPRALAVTSIIYVCFTAFVYLVPLLLNDSSIGVSGGENHHWIKENYWLFYVAMGSTRFLGPLLSRVIRFEREGSRSREFSLWASLVSTSLFCAGAAYLVLPGNRLDFALPLLFGVRILAEAFKPVQAAYLNELLLWRSMRGFALSLTTAMGSLFVAITTAVLLVEFPLYERALESWARPAKSVPVILSALGLIAWVILRFLLREERALDIAKPAAVAASRPEIRPAQRRPVHRDSRVPVRPKLRPSRAGLSTTLSPSQIERRRSDRARRASDALPGQSRSTRG